MLAMWQRWLRARMTLGWALFKHVLSGPWASRRTDPARWLRQMAQESLGATPAGNWQRFVGSSRCVNCGLCDLFGSPELPRPSQLIVGGTRLPADAPLLRQAASALQQISGSISGVCPTQVNVDDVVALIVANAQELEQGRDPEACAVVNHPHRPGA